LNNEPSAETERKGRVAVTLDRGKGSNVQICGTLSDNEHHASDNLTIIIKIKRKNRCTEKLSCTLITNKSLLHVYLPAIYSQVEL
jgi:hypothetical protein